VVAASVIAMGLISLPVMMRYGYNSRIATGTIAAAGSLAQVIPPSLVLIVMADQLGRSVGDIYVGAAYPALLLMALYCVYVFGITLVRPEALPALPVESRTLDRGIGSLAAAIAAAAALYALSYFFVFDSLRYETRLVWSALVATAIIYGLAQANRRLHLGLLSRLAEQVVFVLIPPMALIFLVLGTIFLGIATPTLLRVGTSAPPFTTFSEISSSRWPRSTRHWNWSRTTSALCPAAASSTSSSATTSRHCQPSKMRWK
jgi:TRAP-type mannitol/chloroaromatic compound transport system permease large subunit